MATNVYYRWYILYNISSVKLKKNVCECPVLESRACVCVEVATAAAVVCGARKPVGFAGELLATFLSRRQ